MTDASGSNQAPERLRAHAIAVLTPFFIDGPTRDLKAARQAAAAMLDDYKPVTPKELQLAAQVVALSWASMTCLRASTVVRTMSIEVMLDLQDSALALNAKSVKSSNALLARQRERRKNPQALTPEKLQWDEGTFQLVINQALDKHNDANAKVASFTSKPEPVPTKTKLPILSAEQMTPAVLARRARMH